MRGVFRRPFHRVRSRRLKWVATARRVSSPPPVPSVLALAGDTMARLLIG